VDAALVTTADDGATSCWADVAGTRRRIREIARDAQILTTIDWRSNGRLAQAWIRLPGGEFVGIRGGRAADDRDQIVVAPAPADSREARVVGDFAALDYAAIDHIPVLAEPSRLPPHAGTAILNLLAVLAADTGRDALAYRGPYPTEALFLALLESFRYTPDADDPLAAFAAGTLRWRPAPHRRAFRDDAYVQRRGRVEKVVWRGRAYYRADWQRVARHAPRRIVDEGDVTSCGLWALGRRLETHLAIDATGRVRALPRPSPASPTITPLGTSVSAGVVSIVIAQSAPALAPTLRDVARDVGLDWGPLDADLVTAIPGGLRLSTRLQDAARDVVRAASTRGERLAVAVAVLTEIATLVGDVLRGRAQQRLQALPAAAQASALEEDVEGPSATAIAAAADALATSLAVAT
jgi:hypothetical protein